MAPSGSSSDASSGRPGGSGERSGSGDAASLPKEVEACLRELSATVQKHVMYPSGHPALHPAAARLRKRLRSVLEVEGRTHLIVIARRGRLLVEGAVTDPGNPLLRSLADRLHTHQLHALTFGSDLAEAELGDFLRALAGEADGEDGPLGLAPESRLTAWPHIHLRPLRYEPLRLEETAPRYGEPAEAAPGDAPEGGSRPPGGETATPPPEPAEEAAAGGGGAEVGPEVPAAGPLPDGEEEDDDLFAGDPEAATEEIGRRLAAPERDTELARRILRTARRAAAARGESARRLRDRMSRLVLSLEPETLEYLLRFSREEGREEEFLTATAGSLEADAAMKLVRAAASGREGEIAPWLLRLLTKLAMYGEDGEDGEELSGNGGKPSGNGDEPRNGDHDEAGAGEIIDRIVGEWKLEDPRPSAYHHALQAMSRSPARTATPGPAGGRSDASRVTPDRLVTMGLELAEPAPAVRTAAGRMVAGGEIPALAGLLEETPAENPAARELWKQVATAETVGTLLAEDPPPVELLERLVRRGGVEVAGPLLEALEEPDARRRGVVRLLAAIGPSIGPRLVARLESEGWRVRRNALAVLRELPERPEGFSALVHLHDPDPRVRTEAFRIARDDPRQGAPALLAALGDSDHRIIGLALSAARGPDCPRNADTLIAGHVEDGDLPTGYRLTAARILASRRSPEGLGAFVRLAWVRRWIFWRKLAPASPVLLEVISALARRWPDASESREVLRAARRSEDGRIRAAARPDGDAAPSEAEGAGPDREDGPPEGGRGG